MAADLEKLKHLSQVFDPIYRPRLDAGPDAFYVPEVHADFRRQVRAHLALNDNVKLLIAGQPGCGKTTLLLSLAEELRAEGRLVAFVDLEVLTAVQDLALSEMHVASAAELIRAAEKAGRPVPEAVLSSWDQWLAPLAGRPPRAAASHAEVADGLRALLVAARESHEVRRLVRNSLQQGAQRDPQVLLEQLLAAMADAKPALILDGLDKLPPDQARAFFLLDKRKPLAEAPGAAILTIPISIVYEPTFNLLSERYNNAESSVLPAVRLWELDGGGRARRRSEPGFEVLKKIVSARVEPVGPGILLPKTVDQAIDGSGGNIRELARLIQASIVKALVRAGDFVEPQDVAAAIVDQRESFRRAYQPRFLPVLQKVRAECALDNTDDIGKLLLYGLWVVEYRNGRAWYSLPDAVTQLVEQLEARS